MKRYGEKATREALANGATIRFYDWYTLSGGYRVMIDGEAVGFINCDLFYKLHQGGTIAKIRSGYSYSEYAAQVEEPADDLNAQRDRVHEAVSADLARAGMLAEEPAQEATSAAQESREDENRATCRRIAEELDEYACGLVYRCPNCGEELRLPGDVGDKYRCPHCGAVNDVDDLEQLSMWDYLADVYDVEYRCGSNKEYRSVRVMVACGGPNIYIDTASASVKLYWWSEYAEYSISHDARDAIDEWGEEYWNI